MAGRAVGETGAVSPRSYQIVFTLALPNFLEVPMPCRWRDRLVLSDCAGHVIAHANDLDFDRFVLVGHSMGARIAIELAANWQERVSHLLLLDGSNVPRRS